MIVAFAVLENKEEIVEAFRGLYFGRVVAFMEQTWDMSSAEAEAIITAQAKLFFQQKNRLLNLLAQADDE